MRKRPVTVKNANCHRAVKAESLRSKYSAGNARGRESAIEVALEGSRSTVFADDRYDENSKLHESADSLRGRDSEIELRSDLWGYTPAEAGAQEQDALRGQMCRQEQA
jgi:hypothetical protein